MVRNDAGGIKTRNPVTAHSKDKNAGAPYAHRRFAGRDLSCRTGTLSCLSDGLSGWLAAHGMDKKHMLLTQLFQSWASVLGDDLCRAAHPLGHRNATLLIGCDDSCAMQELSYAAPEILAKVNDFMQEDFFQKVELHLCAEEESLQKQKITQIPAKPPRPQQPKNIGQLKLPADSPVAACYQAYVKFFTGDETN
ncbi:MAG: DUF721 domain-containing protein [Mailhella sp.]|nr:DUF721 domain-containing protein [Mailhella sp.]